MSKSNVFENDILLLIFNNVAIALIGDALGIQPSAVPGNLHISLHTQDPGEGGTQTSFEATYVGYGRVAVPRTIGGWTVSGNQVSNTALIQFGICTSGSDNIQWAGIGASASGAGKILYRSPVGSLTTGREFTAKTTNVITIPGQTFAVNDKLVFVPTPTATLPGGISEGTIYYVISSTVDDITVSTTQGGSSITISSSGAGIVSKIVPLAVNVSIRPQFDPGQIVGIED